MMYGTLHWFATTVCNSQVQLSISLQLANLIGTDKRRGKIQGYDAFKKG